MKHLFVDTNVVIDFLIDRQPFSIQSAEIFELALADKITVHIAAVSYNNIYYILRQSIGHRETVTLLKKLTSFISILAVSQGTIRKALDSDNTDFEDSIQYYTALSNSKIEAIITRDINGFRNSEIPVMTPGEALKML
jgi:predicted nucleic acid-binding protein